MSVLKIILVLILVIFLVFVLFLIIPYNPLRKSFNEDVSQLIDQSDKVYGSFKASDFESFPLAIQEFVKRNGYLGKDKSKYMHISFKDVDFYQGEDRKLLIDYDQYNLAGSVTRLAFIDTSVNGLPFNGYDYLHGKDAFMKGVLAKIIPLFKEEGEDLIQGNSVTYMAEVLFNPTAILESPINFEEIDDYRVRGVLDNGDMRLSGTYHFNEDYEMEYFTCEERILIDDQGNKTSLPWTAKCGEYEINKAGINQPSSLQAIWHYPQGDLVYFDGKIHSLDYGN